MLERCAAPVEMILFDFNADLLAEAAARMPARHRVIALNGDINDGLPAVGAVDVVMCVSALHHVVELERVLADAARLLGDDGEFWSVGEYVGRNGSRLGPGEYARADALFRSFPERIRHHRILQQVDAALPNVDCSSSSFEGVRAEDVLELLHRFFDPEREHLRNCLLWRLTDPAYGPNFDVADAHDAELLRRCVAEDVLCWLQGGRATELNGIYRRRGLRGLPAGAPPAPRLVDFTCNVCGEPCRVPMAQLSREQASCAHCGSTVRMRAMVHLLSVGLFGDSRALVDFPEDRGIRGVGLSDWPGYAAPLAERLGYRNTYYHQRPRLDITQPPADLLGTLDFVIATDVFEHVSPPVDRAFAGAAALLKPGGVLVFSVPYGFDAETVEHYPDLHDFEVRQQDGRYLLVNRTRDGQVQTFADPVFHGGPGQTLELRLFCLDDIRRRAEAVGLGVEVLEDPVWRFGIFDPHPWSRPMLLRKVRGG
jgi:SAM-dependent methyltransferase